MEQERKLQPIYENHTGQFLPYKITEQPIVEIIDLEKGLEIIVTENHGDPNKSHHFVSIPVLPAKNTKIIIEYKGNISFHDEGINKNPYFNKLTHTKKGNKHEFLIPYKFPEHIIPEKELLEPEKYLEELRKEYSSLARHELKELLRGEKSLEIIAETLQKNVSKSKEEKDWYKGENPEGIIKEYKEKKEVIGGIAGTSSFIAMAINSSGIPARRISGWKTRPFELKEQRAFEETGHPYYWNEIYVPTGKGKGSWALLDFPDGIQGVYPWKPEYSVDAMMPLMKGANNARIRIEYD